jgi:hypothetical protein
MLHGLEQATVRKQKKVEFNDTTKQYIESFPIRLQQTSLKKILTGINASTKHVYGRNADVYVFRTHNCLLVIVCLNNRPHFISTTALSKHSQGNCLSLYSFPYRFQWNGSVNTADMDLALFFKETLPTRQGCALLSYAGATIYAEMFTCILHTDRQTDRQTTRFYRKHVRRVINFPTT